MKRSVMSAALESLGYSGTQIEAVFEAYGLALRAEQNRRAYQRRQQIRLLKPLNSVGTPAETAENRKRQSIQRLKRLNSADTAAETALSADTTTETTENTPSPRSLPLVPSPFPCTPSPSPIIPSPTPLSQTTLSRAREKQRGTRLPEGWQPSDEVWEFGKGLGLSGEAIGRELGAFRDYWIAKPGANGTKLDWDATFRNWLRKSAERIRPVDSGYKSPRTRQQEEFLAKLRREIAEDEKNERQDSGEEDDPGLFPRADGESRVRSVGRFQVVAGGRTDGLWGARPKGRCQPHHSYSDVLDLPDDWRD